MLIDKVCQSKRSIKFTVQLKFNEELSARFYIGWEKGRDRLLGVVTRERTPRRTSNLPPTPCNTEAAPCLFSIVCGLRVTWNHDRWFGLWFSSSAFAVRTNIWFTAPETVNGWQAYRTVPACRVPNRERSTVTK